MQRGSNNGVRGWLHNWRPGVENGVGLREGIYGSGRHLPNGSGPGDVFPFPAEIRAETPTGQTYIALLLEPALVLLRYVPLSNARTKPPTCKCTIGH